MSPGQQLDLHTSAAARLQHEGQRYTGNRRRLVDLLADADRPLTIPEILETQGDVPQSSAYRNLGVLERAGVVHRIVTHDEFSRYELAEAFTDDHHHHVICQRCGRVDDFGMPAEIERALERELAKTARRHHLRMEHHRVDIVGVCAACESA